MKRLFLTSAVSFVAKDLVYRFKKPPNKLALAFINTAAEVEEGDLQWLKDDRNALVETGFKVFDYTITGRTIAEVREKLRGADIIFVSGGNTFYLLEQARKSGFDKVVVESVNQGKIYGGSSAGSVVVGPDIELFKFLDEPAKTKKLASFEGIGLVDFVVLPHWGEEQFKDRYTKTMEFAYKKGLKIILLTNDQYVMVEGKKYEIIQVN